MGNRVETFTDRIRNSRILFPVFLVGIVIITIANFTDSLDKLSKVVDRFPKTDKSISVLINEIGVDLPYAYVEFSLINTSESYLEISSIYADDLRPIEKGCSNCSISDRTQLNVSFDRLDNRSHKIFGTTHTIKFKPGGSEPFRMTFDEVSDDGNLLVITLTLNDLGKLTTNTFTLDLFFYVIKSKEDQKAMVKVIEFDNWINKSEPDLRKKMAWAFGDLRDERGLSGLKTLLRDSDLSVRVSAILALGRLEDKSVFNSLLKVLREEKDNVSFGEEGSAVLRKTAAEMLGYYGDKRAIESLYKTWKLDTTYIVANEAIKSIGKLGGTECLKILTSELSEVGSKLKKYDKYKSSIIQALGFVDNQVSDSILIEHVFDHTLLIRYNAIEGLKNTEYKSVEYLVHRTKSAKSKEDLRYGLEALLIIHALDSMEDLITTFNQVFKEENFDIKRYKPMF